jgi:hypothetical protein
MNKIARVLFSKRNPKSKRNSKRKKYEPYHLFIYSRNTENRITIELSLISSQKY